MFHFEMNWPSSKPEAECFSGQFSSLTDDKEEIKAVQTFTTFGSKVADGCISMSLALESVWDFSSHCWHVPVKRSGCGQSSAAVVLFDSPQSLGAAVKDRSTAPAVSCPTTRVPRSRVRTARRARRRPTATCATAQRKTLKPGMKLSRHIRK